MCFSMRKIIDGINTPEYCLKRGQGSSPPPELPDVADPETQRSRSWRGEAPTEGEPRPYKGYPRALWRW